MYDIVNKAMCEIDKNTRNWIEKVYRQGYEDKREDCANQMQEIYEKGLNDAWEYARKISIPENEGGMSVKALQSIFGKVKEIFNCTASEAIAKIKEYEDKQNNKEKDIKDEITISKMLDVLEHVFTCPSELYDRDEAMSRIMETYRELRKKI